MTTNAYGSQLIQKKDFLCFIISEVLLDGLLVPSPLGLWCRSTEWQECVLGRPICPMASREAGGPSSQYPPPGYALIDLTSFYLAPPLKGYPAHPQTPRLVTKPLNTHAFGGHSVKLQQPLSPGMVCMCAFQVTACQIPFLLRQ